MSGLSPTEAASPLTRGPSAPAGGEEVARTTPAASNAHAPPSGLRTLPPPTGLASGRYWICLLCLVGAAVGWQGALRFLNYHTRKDAVPLKQTLRMFDWKKLEPRYRMHDVQMADLNEESLHSLGTREYFMCRLLDSTRPAEDPTAVVDVVMSYYTGSPDLVPHVPTECMVAGGYDLKSDESGLEVRVPGSGAPDDKVRVHLSAFDAPGSAGGVAGAGPGGRRNVTVAYFFHTNGTYCTTRYEVRSKLMNLLERYAYFAKVEIKFSSADLRRGADREQTLAALPPLLERLMPVLLKDHFSWNELHAR